MSKINSNISRRNYLKLSLLGSGALISPSLLMGSSGVFLDKKPNIALIGGGNIAKSAFKDCRNENVWQLQMLMMLQVNLLLKPSLKPTL